MLAANGLRAREGRETNALNCKTNTNLKEKSPHAAGIIFWKYVTTLDSYEAKNYATDFILQGKPAEKVLLRMARSGFKNL